MISFLRVMLILVGLSMTARIAAAAEFSTVEDLEIDRVPGAQGLTGLLKMNSAYTLRAGEVRLHATAFYYDEDDIPAIPTVGPTQVVAPIDNAYIEMPVSFTMGITDNWEIAYVAKLIDYDIETTIDFGLGPVPFDEEEQGLGDSEVLTKIHILDQSEFAPALALGLGVILDTGDEDKGLKGLEDWGARLMAMASVELPIFEESFLGMYFEVQGVQIDPKEDNFDILTLEGSPYKDSYNITSFGVRFPISNDNRLHVMLEFSSESGRETVWFPTLPGIAFIGDGDRDIFTAGLRYAWRYITLSGGYETTEYDLTGIDDVTRYFMGFGMGF